MVKVKAKVNWKRTWNNKISLIIIKIWRKAWTRLRSTPSHANCTKVVAQTTLRTTKPSMIRMLLLFTIKMGRMHATWCMVNSTKQTKSRLMLATQNWSVSYEICFYPSLTSFSRQRSSKVLSIWNKMHRRILWPLKWPILIKNKKFPLIRHNLKTFKTRKCLMSCWFVLGKCMTKDKSLTCLFPN